VDKRICSQCKSTKTFISKGFQQWHIKGNRWLCTNCHANLTYYADREKHLESSERYRDKVKPQRVRRVYRNGLRYSTPQQEQLRKRLLRSNAYYRRELKKAEQELALLNLAHLKAQPKTQGVL
jgi:hypothetical protein